MKDIPRILAAVTLGLIVGAAVNMGLVVLGSSLVPPPAGVDVTSEDGLRRSMHLLSARHFVFPFVAHAAGSLVGALVAAKITPPKAKLWALLVGVFFFAGGLQMATSLPAPRWFVAMDLTLAYLPAAWLGTRLARRPRPTETPA